MTDVPNNPPPTVPAYDREPAIEQKLLRTWRKEQVVVHGRGVALLIVGFVALVIVLLAVDRVLLLPGYARVTLLLAGAAALAWLCYRQWWTRARPYDRLRTALRVERRHHDLASVLVSYVQLESAGTEHSPRLVAAMRREAAEQTAPIPFVDIVDSTPLKRAAGWAAVATALLLGLALLAPAIMSTLLVRMANPFAMVTYPTRTRIESITGDVTIAEGSSLSLSAVAGGVVPPEGVIHFRADEGAWEEARLLASDSKSGFGFTIDPTLESFDYYIRLGDATSRTHRVTVVPSPVPREAAVRVTPPGYTGIGERVFDSLNARAPRGSTATLSLRFDVPLRSVEFLPQDGEPRPFELADGGRSATLPLTIEESIPYRVRWTGLEHGFAFEDGVQYRLQSVPDQPPTVNLLHPADDTPGTLRKTIDIAFTANDDYGLRNAWIVYQVNDGESRRQPLAPVEGVVAERRVAWRPGQDVPELREGDVLSWSIAVEDNGRDESGTPNVGRSSIRRLFVMNEPEYLAWVATRKAEMLGEVQELRETQIDAADGIVTLRAQPPAAPRADEPRSQP